MNEKKSALDGFSAMMGKDILGESKESQAVFCSIFNSLEEGVIVVDRNARFIFFNLAVERFLGISFKNLLSTKLSSVFDCYYPDRTTPYPFAQLLQRAIEGKEIAEVIVFMPNKESSDERYLKIRAGPIRDGNSLIVGGMAIVQDITTDNFGETVSRRKYLLSAQFKGFPIPSYIWQRTGHDFILVDYNEAAALYTHDGIQKTPGIKVSEMYKNMPEIKKSFLDCFANKKNIRQELSYQPLDTVEAQKLIFNYVFIPPDLIQVHIEDWTEHQRIEDEANKLASVVEQTADSVIITDKQGVIEYANQAFERTTGYKLHEVIGQTPKILKSGKHKPYFYKKLWETILSGKSYQGTIVNKKKNQDFYWCEQTITPLKDSAGNITNFVAVIKDISELRRREKYEFHLNIAREIQQRFSAPDVSLPGFDIASASYSAAETSGDYVDIVQTANDELLLAIGDVCGHGIGAALIMAETRAYLRAFAKINSDPGVILSRLNQELVSDLGDLYYVTLILVRLDTRRKTMEYASAGHIPAYLIDASGCIQYVLESTGLPLGFLKDEIPKSNKISLVPGNMLISFTDGLTEAVGPDDSQFGPFRALDTIQKYRKQRASYIAKKLCTTIHAFTAIQPQEDDISTVICKVI